MKIVYDENTSYDQKDAEFWKLKEIVVLGRVTSLKVKIGLIGWPHHPNDGQPKSPKLSVFSEKRLWCLPAKIHRISKFRRKCFWGNEYLSNASMEVKISWKSEWDPKLSVLLSLACRKKASESQIKIQVEYFRLRKKNR